MAEEIHVLFHGKLPNKAALTRTMKELGFPITIADPRESLEKQSGYMPMKLRREESGVEFTIFEGRATVEELGGNDVDPRFDRRASFRWGGDEGEMLCGLCAAAGLAKLVAGVVFEEHEAKLLSVDEAVEYAKRHLSQANVPERLPGARPGDLKRYLKPLLKENSDLILVGRLLLIRPVRHLIRSVYFSTSEKFSFSLTQSLNPLYAAAGERYGGHFGSCDVWRPDFEAIITNTLAEDVLPELGRKTTLLDFAAEPSTFFQFPIAKVTSLVLAGEQDQAREFARQIISRELSVDHVDLFEEQWQLLNRDIATICAEFHAKEKATVATLKLAQFWEPSPFPVEVPAAQRASRCDEPAFTPKPWISRPDGIPLEIPERPGEVCYAIHAAYRKGRWLPAGRLTPEQAEERHRMNESYRVVARLADGVEFLMLRNTGWERHMPLSSPHYHSPDRVRSHKIYIFLTGSLYCAQINTSFGWYDPAPELTGPARKAAIHSAYDVEPEDRRHIFHSKVYESGGGPPIWSCYTILTEGVRTVHDKRKLKAALAQLPSGSDPSEISRIRETTETRSELPLTSEEIALARFSLPPFGEYLDLARRVRELLKVTGFGEIT